MNSVTNRTISVTNLSNHAANHSTNPANNTINNSTPNLSTNAATKYATNLTTKPSTNLNSKSNPITNNISNKVTTSHAVDLPPNNSAIHSNCSTSISSNHFTRLTRSITNPETCNSITDQTTNHPPNSTSNNTYFNARNKPPQALAHNNINSNQNIQSNPSSRVQSNRSSSALSTQPLNNTPCNPHSALTTQPSSNPPAHFAKPSVPFRYVNLQNNSLQKNSSDATSFSTNNASPAIRVAQSGHDYSNNNNSTTFNTSFNSSTNYKRGLAAHNNPASNLNPIPNLPQLNASNTLPPSTSSNHSHNSTTSSNRQQTPTNISSLQHKLDSGNSHNPVALNNQQHLHPPHQPYFNKSFQNTSNTPAYHSINSAPYNHPQPPLPTPPPSNKPPNDSLNSTSSSGTNSTSDTSNDSTTTAHHPIVFPPLPRVQFPPSLNSVGFSLRSCEGLPFLVRVVHYERSMQFFTEWTSKPIFSWCLLYKSSITAKNPALMVPLSLLSLPQSSPSPSLPSFPSSSRYLLMNQVE